MRLLYCLDWVRSGWIEIFLKCAEFKSTASMVVGVLNFIRDSLLDGMVSE